MRLTERNILRVTFAVEGLLVIIFLIWARFRNFSSSPYPGASAIVLGVLLSVPLCLFSYAFFGPRCYKSKHLRSCYEFKDRVIKPLADALSWKSAALVSASAGIGEELFFRGLVQYELGIVASSILFALLHFGPAFFHHWFIGTLYILIGFYFGWLYSWSGDIWLPITVHAAYDFFALIYMKYVYISPELEGSCPRED